ncbi:MAG: SulP family inorganic anion transporter [Pirellulales bacterium]
MADAKAMAVSETSGTNPWLANLKSGFMVFLIALPLCLGIANASECPPVAGIYTAIAGGIIATLLSNSQLTIKGPAAGLIVIVMGCVLQFHEVLTAEGVADAKFEAYRMALAVCVVAGVIQIVFGWCKGGILGDFFPSSAVHGLLASIGVIIMAKQLPVALGVPGDLLKDTHKHPLEPLALILKMPSILPHFNPYVAVIGLVGLVIMFGLPAVYPKITKLVPTQLIVLLVTVPLSIYVLHMPSPGSPDWKYTMSGQEFALSTKAHLVNVPLNAVGELGGRARDLLQFQFLPNFAALKHPIAWKWIALFAIIGSLESLLSSKAVDMLDPRKRKTDLNRDLLAVGVANTLVAFFGGIPMISEIVRSRANIDNGAQSKYANLFHGLFLLASVALIPALLNRIPLAALASMLIFTGFRLAHPREFMHVLHIGREQLIVFVATIVGVLATDLLIGIFIGMSVKLVIHYMNGVPLLSLFRPFLKIEPLNETTYLIKASQSAVFSNWLLFRRQICTYGLLEQKNIVVDFSDTKLVDHTVMEKIGELQDDFVTQGLKLEVVGLESHIALSSHPASARVRGELPSSTPASSTPH